MEESKEKTPAATSEKKTIKKGELFTFFSNAAKSEPEKLTETQEVEGIGPLTGSATELDINGRKKWIIEFKMVLAPPKTKVTTIQPIEGEPGENLVMFATLKSSSPVFTQIQHWASLGRMDEEGRNRLLVFDQWHKVNPSISKTQVMTSAQPGNSLTAPDGTYIRYSEFKLV